MLTYADVCRIGALRYVSLEDNGRGESRSVRLVVKVKNERLKMEAELWSRYTLRMHAAYATHAYRIRYACITHALQYGVLLYMCVMPAYTLELWRI
jgi:hypothetical protein